MQKASREDHGSLCGSELMWSHLPLALDAVLPEWPSVIECSESSYCMTPTKRALRLLSAVPLIMDEE